MIDKTKYNRLRKDPSQLQLFGDEVIEHINKMPALPVPSQEDAGKAVVVDENGQYGLGSISSGTKLYRHNIRCSTAGPTFEFTLITNKEDAFTLETLKTVIIDNDYISSINLVRTQYNFAQYSIYVETLAASNTPSYFQIQTKGLVADSWSSNNYDITEVSDTVTTL